MSAANLVPPLVVSPGAHPAAPQLTTSGSAGRPPRVRTMDSISWLASDARGLCSSTGENPARPVKLASVDMSGLLLSQRDRGTVG